ncbi:MAG: alpha/beta fold hydrolase [Myxococcales bacterium]|nr:MAG: alpha/beta fold hydrolase [Myxococcales bacterium]
MTTFVLLPGAGGAAWYWHRVGPLLSAAGHAAIAVDLPGDDPTAGLERYTDLVVSAAQGRPDVTLVAQSMSGFLAPMVCARLTVQRLVLVNAMIPTPGERAGQWWGHTGSAEAQREAALRDGYSPEFDVTTYFLHDVPPDVLARSHDKQRPEAEIAFREPCRFDAWPAVPTHLIAGRDDRFFPVAFQRRVARERLDVPVDVVPGGHLLALVNPQGLTDQLLAYLA